MERTGVLLEGVGDTGFGGEGFVADGCDSGSGAIVRGGACSDSRSGGGVAEPGRGAVAGLDPLAWSRLDDAEAALRSVSVEGLDESGLRRVVAGSGRVKALADALTLRAAGRLESLMPGSAREVLVGEAKVSGSAARRVVESAGQLEQMPNVGRLVDAGELTLESLFSLGSAAKQCGAAVVDGSDELLYQASARDSGSFSRVARRFAQRHDPSAGGDLLKGQRNSRRGDLFVGGDGMGVLKGETDPVSFGLLEQAVDERKDHLWRRDGGRDGTPDAVRNNAQRTMDAIFELCTGRDALTHEPLPVDDSPRGLRRLPPGQIIVVTAGVVDGTDPDGSCEIIGAGPVPPAVLDRISPDARVVGAIFGGDGQPLWLGRTQRLASVDQYLAVALRDRGCVLCRAPMHRCRLHHVDEFVADEGRTDIENLVALCSNCHRWLHKNNRRAVRRVDSHGIVTWTTEARSSRSRGDDGPPGGGHRGPGGASREPLGRSEGKRRGRLANGGGSAGGRQPVGGAGVAGRAPPFE